MYIPEFLNRWTYPANYAGATWYDYFGSGCGRYRDSDALERANFQAMLVALGFDGDENAPEDLIGFFLELPTRGGAQMEPRPAARTNPAI